MKNLIYEKMGSIAKLRINRPHVLNALNQELLGELQVLLDLITRGQQIKALILTGEGEETKSFIAGADIKEMHTMNAVQMRQFCDLGQQVTLLLENAPFLTIAAINGYALGAGLEMALACDLIYASSTAKLGLPEVSLGIIPGFGGTQRLTRAIGPRLSKEMIMTGKVISAEEALKIGLVNGVSEPDTLLEDCEKVAESIICHSFFATMQAKRAINFGASLDIMEALELEKNMCAVCFGTPEREKEMQAFLDKQLAHHK